MKFERRGKSGQAIIFLIFVLLIGTVVVIWNFNLHRGVVAKIRMRDAGDSAALVAARWQGISLNMIGELNLVQAALVTEALADGLPDEDEYGEIYEDEEDALYGMIGDELDLINNLRNRIAIHGPLIAFAAAQQLAFNNRIHKNNAYSTSYEEMLNYIDSSNTEWQEAADEYWSLLASIADNGIAARTIPTLDSHILFDAGFYNAIYSGAQYNDWCAFYYNSEYRSYLENYTSASDWPDLPEGSGFSILGLEVHQSEKSLVNLFDGLTNDTSEVADAFQDVADEWNDGVIDADAISLFSLDWAVYGSSWNQSWQAFIDYNELPFRNTLLEQFDYMGPEAIFEINIGGTSAGSSARSSEDGFEETYGGAPSATIRNEDGTVKEYDFKDQYKTGVPERSTRSMRWISAAKIFGSIDQGSGETPLTPNYFGIVLPSFTEARLIPVQRVVSGVNSDPLAHNFVHVPELVETDDISVLDSSCSDCQLLIWFDDAANRQLGIDWLADDENAEECEERIPDPVPGGGGGGGGAPFGH